MSVTLCPSHAWVLLAEGPGLDYWFLLLGGMFAIFYFFVIRPQSRQNRARQEMITALKKNDRVLLNSGIFGTVAAIKEDEVTILIDDKVRMRVTKGAIGTVLTKDGTEKEGSTKPSGK